MRSANRRTATRIKDGRVQKKNNWNPDPKDYYVLSQSEIQLDRRAPGRGHRHLLTIAQLRSFIELLPDWEQAAVGLDAIVLDSGRDYMGWHMPGIVAICAWEQELWWADADRGFEEDHRHLLDLLDVERVEAETGVEMRWTEEQARAFQLLHVLPHELGHHHDRMATRSKVRAARGEDYAERYAMRVLEVIWPQYAVRFGL
jgi:hypothetical protein